MILSFSLGLIFIKGAKVGGTSVEMALARHCGPGDIITAITPRDEQDRLRSGRGAQNFADDPAAEREYLQAVRDSSPFSLGGMKIPRGPYTNHMALTRVAELQPDAVRNFDLIAVERDPYSKVLSLANMRLSFSRYQTGGEMSDPDQEILRQRAQEVVEQGEMTGVLNMPKYKNASGRCATTIMRLTSLESDTRAVLRRRGVELAGPFPHAKRGASSNDRDPREYFERRHLDAINAMFAEEFDCFGYQRL